MTEGFLRHDLNANRGRPDLALAHDSTADPDTPIAQAAAQLMSQDLQQVFGPYLRFNNWDINTGLWTGSVLIVAHHSVTSRPSLNFTSGTGGNQSSDGILLDTYGQHNFWRFSLGTSLGQQPQILQYSLHYGPGASMPQSQSYTVHLPSRDQPWHWGFHSCSGFSLSVHQADWGGVAPLWRDLLEQHQASPLHLVVGGGDQLYNDALFKLPTTKTWLAIKDAKERDLAPFNQTMAQEVYEYYFRNYAVHFSSEAMSLAFATIPQTMTWDDHDIFDGWGSYPDGLQNCPVFQGCYQAAKRFYLLFQQHTTEARVPQLSDMFGHRGFSMVKQCGPQLALVIPDARAERTKPQVIDPQSWDMIFDRMRALPPSTRHVVMVTTVPVVYPQIPGSEKILETVSGADRGNKLANLLKKTGLTKAAMSSFGEPELLDDLADHWNAGNHKEERRMLIEKCQQISAAQCIRISFLSGDVHVCAAGRLYSDPKVNLANDHRYMPQIVSSAIVNAPPPDGVIKTLHLCSQAHKNIDKATKEKMLRIFHKEPGLGDKLAGRRNWCEIWEASSSIPARNQPLPEYQVAAQGSLVFTLRLEMDKNRPGVSVKPFDIPIVPLMTQGGAFATGSPGFSHSSSSVAGINSGMAGMALNGSSQPNQAGQGQGQYAQPNQAGPGQGQYGQPNQAGQGQGQYGQPNLTGQGQNGQPNQVSAGYSPVNQGAGGGVGDYSPLGQGQHGQLNQTGQGQGQNNQTGQGQGQYNQTGQGQGQYNQTGQGQYSPSGQGQFGQPSQAAGAYPPTSQSSGAYSSSSQSMPHQAAQAGQPTGGFPTYPEMSSSNAFSGNQPYGSPSGGSGANQYNQNAGAQQSQQQTYTGQQGNSGNYAAYPDLGSGNTGGYGQGNSVPSYGPSQSGTGSGSQAYDSSSNDYIKYGQGGGGQSQVLGGYSGPAGNPQFSQSGAFTSPQYSQSGMLPNPQHNQASSDLQYGQSSPFAGSNYGQAGAPVSLHGQPGMNASPSWPNAPHWDSQVSQGNSAGSSNATAGYHSHPYGDIPPTL